MFLVSPEARPLSPIASPRSSSSVILSPLPFAVVALFFSSSPKQALRPSKRDPLLVFFVILLLYIQGRTMKRIVEAKHEMGLQQQQQQQHQHQQQQRALFPRLEDPAAWRLLPA
jgi:hypothetical protein